MGLPASLKLSIFVALALALAAGCGDDDGGTRPTPGPTTPPESPQDVIDNMAMAYNQRDYERYQPLIRDGFSFWFDERDADDYPDIPSDGYWGKSEELDCTSHMLDPDYTPDDPRNKIDDIHLDLELDGTQVPTTIVSDPPPPYGTLEGYVTLDLKLETGDGMNTYLVNSRPLFYFTPDTTVTPNTWTIWRIEDDRPEDAAAAASPAEPATEKSTWGAVKSIYR